ncbi:MAG: hypothetical protein LBL66_04160 [Clostridiales bacterium]|nr:hypothetical protein [Clostridiales bacterium]
MRSRTLRGRSRSPQCTVHSAQFRSGDIAQSVPLSGRDCRVALRAPRNDKRGVPL